MPNYCMYSMCVKGTKENIEEFIKVIKADYNYDTMEFTHDRHMFRVFEADYNEIEEMLDGTYQVVIDGDCAWSVASCMLDENLYYQQIKERYPNEFRGTTLQHESERLNLDIEVFSEECGMCFQEHYLVRKGIMEISQCVDYEEYDKDEFETKKEAEEEWGIVITDEEWNDGSSYIVRGGVGYWDFTI